MERALFKTRGRSEMLKGMNRWWGEDLVLHEGESLEALGKNKGSSLMRAEDT